MRPLLIPVLGSLLLAACLSGPRTVESTNPTVTYRYADDEYEDVLDEAQRYCADFGLNAELVDRDSDGDDNVAVFECTA